MGLFGSSTPIARTGQPPPFSSPSPSPNRRRDRSVSLARRYSTARGTTHLDDQLDLGHVAVTGAVLVIVDIVVRHPDGGSPCAVRKKEGTFVPWCFSAIVSLSLSLFPVIRGATKTKNEQSTTKVRGILTQRVPRAATFTPLAPPAAHPPNHVTLHRARAREARLI